MVIWVLQGTGGRDVPKTKCLPYGTDGRTKYLRILETLQHWVRECRDLFLLLVDQEAKELLYVKTSPWYSSTSSSIGSSSGYLSTWGGTWGPVNPWTRRRVKGKPKEKREAIVSGLGQPTQEHLSCSIWMNEGF